MVGDHEEVAGRLEAGIPWQREARGVAGRVRRFPDRERYLAMVREVKEHIVRGDVFQCVPSQRAERPTSATPLELYRALRRVNPSPYLFLLELDGMALVGSSPERLVACEDGRASLCPIAGTTEPTEGDVDRLLSSEKDRAEHVMLVDLGRNDLSRVCRAGTVHVARSMEVERFSHVSHLVSEVVGEVREGISPFDVLRACFPAGTVSGAPKIRAMQLISELEGFRRGPYGGRRAVLPPGRHHGRVHRAPDDDRAGRHRLSPGGGGHRRGLRPGRRARGMPAEARRARGRDRPRRTGARAMTRPLATADGHGPCNTVHKVASCRAACPGTRKRWQDESAGARREARCPTPSRTPWSGDPTMKILMIDNYDSFTYNLVHLFEQLGAEVVTFRNDALSVDDAVALEADRLVISPGPGRPEDAGASVELLRRLGPTTRSLGVCLGHQAIVQAYGGEIGQAHALLHGKASHIRHDGRGVFGGLPEDIEVGRYHSLAATVVPDVLHVTARTEDGEVMGVRHFDHPVEGVQFHPESVLTPLGERMAENFLS